MRVILRNLRSVELLKATDEHCHFTACGDVIHRENSPMPLPPIDEQETRYDVVAVRRNEADADAWLR